MVHDQKIFTRVSSETRDYLQKMALREEVRTGIVPVTLSDMVRKAVAELIARDKKRAKK